MGWDGHKGHESVHDQARRISSELNSDWELLKHEIYVESANEFTHYLAFRNAEGIVSAFVVLVEQTSDSDGQWTYYKWLHEMEGPFAHGASRELIAMLTPIDESQELWKHEYARECAANWRQTCAGVRHPITGQTH